MKRCCATESAPPRVDLLHARIDLLLQEDLARLAAGAIRGGRLLFGHHNLHSLYLCREEGGMAAFYRKADYVHIDGMSLVFLGRLLGLGLDRQNRLTSLDWLLPLLRHCREEQYGELRLFLLGGKPGVVEKAGDHFAREVPGLTVAGRHGYFDMHDPGENGAVLQEINAFSPHLLLVGMGMPRQEEWLCANYELLEANVTWSLGAFMDYYAGVIPVPPRWLGRLGLEWAYRLLSEPRRLWRRYLVEPWCILWLLAGELYRRKATSGRKVR